MGARRGLLTSERLAVLSLSASGDLATALAGASFVYGITVLASDTNTTGTFNVSDSTSTADANKDAILLRGRLGTNGASATTNTLINVVFNPPVYAQSTGGVSVLATGCFVTIRYLPAS